MKRNSIKVFAPATLANMSCGFDIMGFAIDGVGDVVEMTISDGDEISIVNKSGVDIPFDINENVMTPPLRAMMEKLGKRYRFEIVIHEKIRPGSGIGSSAASSSAVVFAFNELCGKPFSDDDLIYFAALGEQLVSGGIHADNVAPSIMGGIVLVRDYNPIDVVRLKSPLELFCVVVHPFIEVRTKDSRAALKKEIPISDAVVQWANVGSLVAGLLYGDLNLIGRAMKDVVAEPYRKVFIPEYDALKRKAIEEGVIGCSISGSGPSVFALCECEEDAVRVGDIMQKHFSDLSVSSDIYISAIGDNGVREMID